MANTLKRLGEIEGKSKFFIIIESPLAETLF
jgi:hypothetical protein